MTTDPVEARIAEETAADHATARVRGRHVLDVTNAVIGELRANGMLVDPDDARVALFHVLANALYGTDVALDIPTLRRPRT
jgi:hypothetical protein